MFYLKVYKRKILMTINKKLNIFHHTPKIIFKKLHLILIKSKAKVLIL